jgi:hypothetical protein
MEEKKKHEEEEDEMLRHNVLEVAELPPKQAFRGGRQPSACFGGSQPLSK